MNKQEIYSQKIDENSDTLNFGNNNSILKEEWYLFDTSIYCRLSDYIETGNVSCKGVDDLIYNLRILIFIP